ncbi:MAG: hypothetical protein CL940_08235 [Deltaproteobacteria bacterium]|nr:hypothetical protein [Deltaproteobacteria bacterium]
MTDVELSVVVPVYNEVAVLDELIGRCVTAAAMATEQWELIVVDDCSSDGSAERLSALSAKAEVQHLRLLENVGQFRATCAGLRASRGRVVVVLDGDLQDPPERIPELYQQLKRTESDRAAAFAIKTRRSDSMLFRIGRWLYGLLSSFAAWRIPPGAGAYCAMPGSLARRIPRVPSRQANLAPFVAAVSERIFVVPYEKQSRYDEQSRVGFPGLVVEALSTLQYSGSLERLAWAWSAGLAVSQLWGGALIIAGLGLGLRRRRVALEGLLRG